VIVLQKKIVVDENGVPQEVIIPWSQFCELAETLGLDLDEEAIADLRVTRADLERGDQEAFMPVNRSADSIIIAHIGPRGDVYK